MTEATVHKIIKYLCVKPANARTLDQIGEKTELQTRQVQRYLKYINDNIARVIRPQIVTPTTYHIIPEELPKNYKKPLSQ